MTRVCIECRVPFEAGRYARWGLCCRWKHRGKPKKYVWTPERDDLLRRKYDGRKGTAGALAAGLNFPSWVVKRRAAELGLTKRPVNRRPWTAEEDAFLDEHLGVRLVAWIARRLGRSVTSVVMRIKHRKLSRAIRDGYTMRELEMCFGVDHHEIERWIRLGWMRGGRRHGKDGPAFSRDAWRFTDRDLLDFIRKHPTDFRLDRVDQVWFLDLVFNSRRAERVA